MQLPLVKSEDQSVNLQSTRWKSQLDPLLANELNNTLLLMNISLSVGSNTINHKLGRLQRGWIIVDLTAPAQIYRSAPLTSTTLTLTSDTDCTVSLAVF